MQQEQDTSERVSLEFENPWGKPGINYSENYRVTSLPLVSREDAEALIYALRDIVRVHDLHYGNATATHLCLGTVVEKYRHLVDCSHEFEQTPVHGHFQCKHCREMRQITMKRF